jgi:hypothetical protein
MKKSDQKVLNKLDVTNMGNVAEVMKNAIFTKRATAYNKWLKEKSFPAVQSLLQGNHEQTVSAFKNIFTAITGTVTFTKDGFEPRNWEQLSKNIIPKITSN